MSPLIRSVGLRRGGTFTPPVQDFTPADLPGLALWLDAADAASISLNGSAVTQWNDKSGNGRHFAQGTAAQQPAYVPGAHNGRAALRFDGVNDRLGLGVNSLLRAAPGLTCYVVALTTGSGGQIAFWVENNRTLNQARLQIAKTSAAGNNHTLGHRRLDTQSLVALQSGSTWEEDILYCVGGITDWAAQTHTIRLDGAQAAHQTSTGTSGTFSDTNSSSAYVGTNRSGDVPWEGDICEVILLPRALTPTEIIKLETYLLQKWGISI